jgi:hypothetical protein
MNEVKGIDPEKVRAVIQESYEDWSSVVNILTGEGDYYDVNTEQFSAEFMENTDAVVQSILDNLESLSEEAQVACEQLRACLLP